MAMPKAATIGLGLAMVGVGVFQVVHGFQQCNGPPDLEWGDKRATSVELGDFTIKIPDGWRDAAESGDDKMKHLIGQQPGAKMLVREKFDGQSVVLKAGPSEPVASPPPCQELATTLAKTENATAAAITQQTYDGDPGCRWNASRGDTTMQYNVRFHGSQVFLVACSGADGGPCQQVLAGVTVKK